MDSRSNLLFGGPGKLYDFDKLSLKPLLSTQQADCLMNFRFKEPDLVVLAAILALGSGCNTSAPSKQAETAKKPIPVKTVSVVEQTLQKTTTQPATVHAYYEVEIQPKVTGYVSDVHFDIGDVVQKGDVLAVIHIPEMNKQLEILEAKVARNQAGEQQAQSGIELAQADVISAEARLSQAKSEMSRVDAVLAAAEAEFLRTQDLVQRQSLESRMLDEVRKMRDSELAAKDSVASAIASAEANVTVAKAKLAAARSDLAAAKAETDIVRKQIEELDVLMGYATLTAPFAGVVTKRSVDPGALVREAGNTTSRQSLFTISQIDKVRIHIPVPEADAATINRGDSVSVSFPFFPGESAVEGTVTRTSNSLDPMTRTMLVEAEVENTDGKLIPGLFGQATIGTASKAVAQMLPARAIRFTEDGKAYIYVIDDNETVSVVDIETGFDDGNMIEVLSNISRNQRVIDNHLKRFTDGQKVTIVSN